MRESYDILNQANDEYESARTQLALAQVSLVQQEYGQGLDLLDRCTATFERLQAELDLATARAVRARFPA
jgi:flagellin-specific chaperone FliS